MNIHQQEGVKNNKTENILKLSQERTSQDPRYHDLRRVTIWLIFKISFEVFTSLFFDVLVA